MDKVVNAVQFIVTVALVAFKLVHSDRYHGP